MTQHDPSALPVHPFTGLTAIGVLPSGRIVWPVLGGSGDDNATQDADADAGEDADAEPGGESAADENVGDDADADDDEPLGQAGVKALLAEKERRRAAARLRRQAVRERDEALARLTKLQQEIEQQKAAPKGGKADGEAKPGPDLDAIRAEAEEAGAAKVKAAMLTDRVSDKIEVLAARRFQNTEDAVVNLLRSNEISDFLDGDKVDAEAIREALDELLEKKPYLAVPAQSDSKRFRGSGDGGAKPNKPARPRSLGEALARKLNSSS